MAISQEEILDFGSFLLRKTYRSKFVEFDKDIIVQSVLDTIEDVQFHFSNVSEIDVWERITNNSNELAIFLYRLGRKLWVINSNDAILGKIHWLMKELCSCEIYFSSSIDIGFYIFHGEGLVIGSRNIIGKGLRVYQNVTIGHKIIDDRGVRLGDNVRIYSGAKVLGNISIGDNVVVGANTVLTKSISNNIMVYGNPNVLSDLIKSNLL